MSNIHTSEIKFQVELDENRVPEKLFWSAPPEGATFYYLTFNLSKEVVVVCSYPTKKNGWHDWFYSWDMTRNALSCSGPAY